MPQREQAPPPSNGNGHHDDDEKLKRAGAYALKLPGASDPNQGGRFRAAQCMEIESQSKTNLKQYRSEGNHTSVSRTQAAESAGLSKHQTITAIRVSRIPDDEFHEAVESDNPPTVTALAERSKQSRPKPLVIGKEKNQ